MYAMTSNVIYDNKKAQASKLRHVERESAIFDCLVYVVNYNELIHNFTHVDNVSAMNSGIGVITALLYWYGHLVGHQPFVV